MAESGEHYQTVSILLYGDTSTNLVPKIERIDFKDCLLEISCGFLLIKEPSDEDESNLSYIVTIYPMSRVKSYKTTDKKYPTTI